MSLGPPLPPPPTSAGRTAVALVAGLATAVVAAAVAVALSLSISPAGSATPEDAVRAYLTADQGHDCEELVRHPVTGYADLEECEDDVAEEAEQYRDDGIDPDSFTFKIERLEVTQESDDLARVWIDLFVAFDQRGEEQTSGGYQAYEVSRDDDGWVVDDLVYED